LEKSNNTMRKSLLVALLAFNCNLIFAQSGEKKETPKIPFENIDATWQNGSDMRDSVAFHTPFFTPIVMADINYTYSNRNPNDNTVVGSTALARNNEVQVSAVNLGGDFTYGNAHAHIVTQFGTRSTIIPRNDNSIFRGQYNLDNVYRYLPEGYAGYHFNKWYGINVDAGIFCSYIGLNSYYQAENWEYQASFTSDNTPWFFNGVRVQMFPKKHLKLEAWIINGWQSYGKYNSLPGFGGNITWNPSSNFKILSNDYLGFDTKDKPGRKRFHSDNSILLRYLNRPGAKGITKMAFSLTGDFGFESGAGVSGFSGDADTAQYFLSCMFYNRTWFANDKIAWTIGGGMMKNPGRYLVLSPTGQAGPGGIQPFSLNTGDQFSGWDVSTNLDFMPNTHFTFRLEYVLRNASVPYFAGRGGVTSPDGYTTTPLPAGWQPDLVKQEQRVIAAILFRL